MYITGHGYSHPKESVTNEELVFSFNEFVDKYNREKKDKIEKNELLPLKKSSADFIYNASGIKKRYVRDKDGLLDPNKLWPTILDRPDEQLSIQAEEGVIAAKKAIEMSGIDISEIGAVIVACSHKQRDYPTVSIEIQNALEISGFAFDIGNACSSSIYGIQIANALIISKKIKSALVISPEIKSGQFDPKDRDSHFIFGEATTALIIENDSYKKNNNIYKIKDIDLYTKFSNNIRNNRGAYSACSQNDILSRDKMFYQNGRVVFKEVTKMVSERIKNQLEKNSIKPNDVFRFWLHQANIKMNRKIIKLILDNDFHDDIAPTTLEDFGNTSSSGSILSFAINNKNIPPGSICILSSFGAGYSFGSIILEKTH